MGPSPDAMLLERSSPLKEAECPRPSSQFCPSEGTTFPRKSTAPGFLGNISLHHFSLQVRWGPVLTHAHGMLLCL